MKIILAIIAASCIVVCTKALSCYQCQDLAFQFTDPAVAEKMEQNAGDGGAPDPPKCVAFDMFACHADNLVCTALELSMEGTMYGESVAAVVVTRACALPDTSEESHCSEAKSAMTSSSDGDINFKSCKLHVCSTDNCNTHGMEDDGEGNDGEKDDGEGNDGEKDEKDDGEGNDGEKDEKDDGEREKYVSSETKLTISFLLIQLVSFLSVAFL